MSHPSEKKVTQQKEEQTYDFFKSIEQMGLAPKPVEVQFLINELIESEEWEKAQSRTFSKHSPGEKYRPELCIYIIEMMSEGKSRNTVMVEIGISDFCMRRWEKIYPEFDLAVKIGTLASLRWWEEVGRRNLWNKNFNYPGWIMNMNNRFRKFGWSRSDQTIGIDIETKSTHEEIKTERKELIINTDEQTTELLNILIGCGAIKSPAQNIIDAEVK